MSTSVKVPPSTVLAEVNYLEFHNTKGSLPNGTYRVVEADESISYAALSNSRGLSVPDITWYSEAEYEDWMTSEHPEYDVFDDDHPGLYNKLARALYEGSNI